MTRPRVLITAPFTDSGIRKLSERYEVSALEPSISGASLVTRGIAEELARTEILIVELDEVDQATLDAAPELKLVVTCHASPVNVDTAACEARGIRVATTPGRNAAVTADFAFALILNVVRKLGVSERWLREKSWQPTDVFEPYERFRSIGLAGRTLGIVGGGAVGSRVLRRALGFDMSVQVYDPYLSNGAFGDDARLVDLDTLMSTSDIVTVHAPLTPATRGLIGERELSLMPPTSFLVNAGRAALIDEAPLLRVLRDRRIAGAGFDVFYDEPLAHDSELYDFENVTLTPHIAGASDDVVTEHSRLAIDAIRQWEQVPR